VRIAGDQRRVAEQCELVRPRRARGVRAHPREDLLLVPALGDRGADREQAGRDGAVRVVRDRGRGRDDRGAAVPGAAARLQLGRCEPEQADRQRGVAGRCGIAREQDERGRAVAVGMALREPLARQGQPGATEVVELGGHDLRGKAIGELHAADLVHELRGGGIAAAALGPAGREARRAAQAGRGELVVATVAGAPRRSLERGGERGVDAGRADHPVPRRAVGVGGGDHRGERLVPGLALRRRRRVPDRRPRERMGERDPVAAERDEVAPGGRRQIVGRERPSRQRARGCQHRREVAAVVERRDQQRLRGRGRQRARCERVRQGGRQRRPRAEQLAVVGVRIRDRQLGERQRAPVRLPQHARADQQREPRRAGVEERLRRGGRERRERQRGQLRRRGGVPPEQERDGRVCAPPDQQCDRVERGRVEPLRVVHAHEQRRVLRGVGDDAQRGERDVGGVRLRPLVDTERHAQRIRQRLPPQGPEQLVQARVGVARLRLDPERAQHRHAAGGGAGGSGVEQGADAAPARAVDGERGARGGVVEEPLEPCELGLAAEDEGSVRRVHAGHTMLHPGSACRPGDHLRDLGGPGARDRVGGVELDDDRSGAAREVALDPRRQQSVARRDHVPAGKRAPRRRRGRLVERVRQHGALRRRGGERVVEREVGGRDVAEAVPPQRRLHGARPVAALDDGRLDRLDRPAVERAHAALALVGRERRDVHEPRHVRARRRGGGDDRAPVALAGQDDVAADGLRERRHVRGVAAQPGERRRDRHRLDPGAAQRRDHARPQRGVGERAVHQQDRGDGVDGISAP
jgi:hypothetical protein